MKGHELQMAYERAGPYIAQRVRELIKLHGWTLQSRSQWYLFELIHESDANRSSSSSISFQSSIRSHKRNTPHFRLPLLVADFLRPSRFESWEGILADKRLVKCKRPNAWSHDLYINSPEPLVDIFYLLQVLIPGMIQIKRIDWIEGVGDQHITRVLPRESWIQKNAEDLEHILGDSARVRNIMECASETTSVEITWDRSEYRDCYKL
ncbi:uncharacterized protein EI90DRAFT_3049751 [Cantharellus anzutake]|uniref:uncharacterized protein n=1 Tax=Cantharellus anzutake TaxID=1750568 RepID=UPI0019072820|nr:uncharacterized protein EI90DRAFT_3049751 [Cantharellus anzutake]KAF8334666.1 hypothetical protein EI90DRAFT_3049751 [Cantharellus anzutake]